MVVNNLQELHEAPQADLYLIYIDGKLYGEAESLHLARVALAHDLRGVVSIPLVKAVKPLPEFAAGLNALNDCLMDCADSSQALRLALGAMGVQYK